MYFNRGDWLSEQWHWVKRWYYASWKVYKRCNSTDWFEEYEKEKEDLKLGKWEESSCWKILHTTQMSLEYILKKDCVILWFLFLNDWLFWLYNKVLEEIKLRNRKNY